VFELVLPTKHSLSVMRNHVVVHKETRQKQDQCQCVCTAATSYKTRDNFFL